MPSKIATLQPVTLSGFPAGIANRQREVETPDGAAWVLKNVDITRAGNILRRKGYATVSGATAGHSLWSHPAVGFGLYVTGAGNLTRIGSDGTRTTLAAVQAAARMSYTLFNDRIYYSNGVDRGYVDSLGAVKPWGIDTPPAPSLTAVSGVGGLSKGRYLAAFTVLYNSGEESQPSRVSEIELAADGGGISMPVFGSGAITHINIYCTSTQGASGTDLYLHGTVANGITTYSIGRAPEGRPLVGLNKGRPPAGNYLASFKRRILIGRGREVWFTELGQASMADPRHGWLSLPEAIRAILPVQDGCFIGTDTRVYWCAGADPEDWTVTQVLASGVIPHVSNPYFPDDWLLPQGLIPQPGVPFLTTDSEFCIARNSGFIQRVSGERVAIQRHQLATLHYRETAGLRQVLATFANPIGSNTRLAPEFTPTTVTTVT